MSTTAADPEGFVVITEVSPKANEAASSMTPSKPDLLQNFFKGEPLALGTAQMLCGVFQIAFGILCDVHGMTLSRFKFFLFISGVPFWSGVLYIISGSLSVAATKNPRIGLVRGSLIMNIIAAAASGVAIFLYTLHVLIFESRYFFGYLYCDYRETPEMCQSEMQSRTVSYAIICLLLLLAILGLCTSTSTSVFGCKTLCRTAYSEVSVVIYQTTSPQPAQHDSSAAPLSPPDAHTILPSFKESENTHSVSLIETL